MVAFRFMDSIHLPSRQRPQTSWFSAVGADKRLPLRLYSGGKKQQSSEMSMILHPALLFSVKLICSG